jgi:hypothetical protein
MDPLRTATESGPDACGHLSAIGMADGRQHDLNADERMRPTAHIDAPPRSGRVLELEAIDVVCPECDSIAKLFGTVDVSRDVDFDVEPVGGGQYDSYPSPYTRRSGFNPQTSACRVCQFAFASQDELTEAGLRTNSRVVSEDDLGE